MCAFCCLLITLGFHKYSSETVSCSLFNCNLPFYWVSFGVWLGEVKREYFVIFGLDLSLLVSLGLRTKTLIRVTHWFSIFHSSSFFSWLQCSQSIFLDPWPLLTIFFLLCDTETLEVAGVGEISFPQLWKMLVKSFPFECRPFL